MFESLAKLIENTFTKFSYPKLLSLLTIFLLLILVVISLEYYTNYGYYLRLENKTELLIKLNTLSNNDISSNPKLYPIYLELVKELKNKDVGGQTFLKLFSSNLFNKIWSALIIPFLIAVIAWFGSDNIKTRDYILGIVFFGSICLLFGLLFPSFENIRINIAINIVFSILIVIGATKLDNKDYA